MAREAKELAEQAQRLRDLRKMARVSQVTAANGIGVTPRAYQVWEAGGEMMDENRKKAAAYFGTTEDYIQFGVIERKRGPAPDLQRDDRVAEIERLARENLDRLKEVEARLGQLVDLLSGDRETRDDLFDAVVKTVERGMQSHEGDQPSRAPAGGTGHRLEAPSAAA